MSRMPRTCPEYEGRRGGGPGPDRTMQSKPGELLWRMKNEEATWTRPPSKHDDEPENEFEPPKSKTLRREEFLKLSPLAGIVGSGEDSSWLRLDCKRIVFIVG